MATNKPLKSPVEANPKPFRDSLTPSDYHDEDDLAHVSTGADTYHDDIPLLTAEEMKTSKIQPTPSAPVQYDPYHEKTSPTKSTVAFESYDEEKLKPEPTPTPKLTPLKQKQRILDITQRATTLALSVIVLGIMSHAYLKFLANKNVTVDGMAIYPTFMQLWPTYLMIAAGAVTVALNAVVLGLRIHGSVKDFHREELYNELWDYALHGVNGLIWLGTSTSFGVTKNMGPAADPNVLWGYVCSPTANNLTETYPQILKFYIQCELQTVSFWTAVSSVMVEVFAVAAKLFVR